ncbi:hypothetical protein BKP42_36230 [Rhodococcus erythropolis]|uniref:hypothetical protein n=1 Tax=Rhodococcus erythropolis TaxID=1833 RepID=UPI000BB380BA|nr:hypothetical protein [Rhodococcus erythropolis]PBI96963.1 hypothetical protein BKP42_36230 [Rhodococcus erythropolis]
MTAPDPGKPSIVEPTRFGFKWGPLEVERTSTFHGSHVLTIAPKGKRKSKQAITVYVSKAGQSVRVFKNGKEMKVNDDDQRA